MKKKLFVLVAALIVSTGTAFAQFGIGIVYDPTNYSNALLRYYQLQQHLIQLKNSYAQLVQQYNLAVQMSKNLQNMPARYRAQFSQWRNTSAQDTYGNTNAWVTNVNTGNTTGQAYQQATTQLLPYSQDELGGMTADELARIKSQYASVELSDGANATAIGAIGAIRGNAQTVQTQIGNLEQDSLSNDPNLNTEVAVLNKINAAGVLTLRSIQDSNKLLASVLEENTILAKQQREAVTNAINADIYRQATFAATMNQLTGTLTNTLQQFRMP